MVKAVVEKNGAAPAAEGVATPANITPITQGRKPRAAKPEAAVGPSDAEPAIVVFGLDDAGKAHASWFSAAEAELATKAAGLMGFKALRVTAPDIRAKALEAPAGRIFESGKAFSPFCKMGLHEALCAFEGVFEPPAPPAPEPATAPAVTSTPQRWEDLSVGALVLASTGEPMAGWFESVVVEDRGEGLLVLRWRDFPDDEPFVRRIDGLALLPAVAA